MCRRQLSLAVVAPVLFACRSHAPSPVVQEPTSSVAEATAPRRQLQVGFLLVDGVYGSELVAPFDVFHHTVFHADPGMRVFTVGRERRAVTTFEGLRIEPDFGFDAHPPIDVLVVPSAENSMGSDLADRALVDWVADAGLRADWVLSFCDGAFVLAQAGLLDRRRSTTFPADVALLRARFPTLEVLEDVSFVHDGPCITSVGGAKSYEAALYLCELLYGRTVAEEIGRGLVIDWDLASVPHAARKLARSRTSSGTTRSP
jgi:transcriptional regulator GlxA family with amidase domain